MAATEPNVIGFDYYSAPMQYIEDGIDEESTEIGENWFKREMLNSINLSYLKGSIESDATNTLEIADWRHMFKDFVDRVEEPVEIQIGDFPPSASHFTVARAVRWLRFMEDFPTEKLRSECAYVASLLSKLWPILTQSQSVEVIFYLGWAIATLLYRTRSLNRNLDTSKDRFVHLNPDEPLPSSTFEHWRKLLSQYPNILSDQIMHSDEMSSYKASGEVSGISFLAPNRSNSCISSANLPHFTVFSWLCYEYQCYWNTSLPSSELIFLEDFLNPLLTSDPWRNMLGCCSAIVTSLDVLAQASDKRIKSSVVTQDILNRWWRLGMTFIKSSKVMDCDLGHFDSTHKYRLRVVRSSLDLLCNLLWWSPHVVPTSDPNLQPISLSHEQRTDTLSLVIPILQKCLAHNWRDDTLYCNIVESCLQCLPRVVYVEDQKKLQSRNDLFLDKLLPCIADCVHLLQDFLKIHLRIQIRGIKVVLALLQYSDAEPAQYNRVILALEQHFILSGLRIHLLLDQLYPCYLLNSTKEQVKALLNERPSLSTSYFQQALNSLQPSQDIEHVQNLQAIVLRKHEPLCKLVKLLFHSNPSTEQMIHLLQSLCEVTNLDKDQFYDDFLWKSTPQFEHKSFTWSHAWVALLRSGIQPSSAIAALRAHQSAIDGSYTVEDLADCLFEVVRECCETDTVSKHFHTSFFKDPLLIDIATKQSMSEDAWLFWFLSLWQIVASRRVGFDIANSSSKLQSYFPSSKLELHTASTSADRVMICVSGSRYPSYILTVACWLDINHSGARCRVALITGSCLWGHLGEYLQFGIQTRDGNGIACELISLPISTDIAFLKPSKLDLAQTSLPLSMLARVSTTPSNASCVHSSLWKCGNSTGLTATRFVSESYPLVTVSEFGPDGSVAFAFPGDSGALVFEQKGMYLHPMAIYIVSSGGGAQCIRWKILEEFGLSPSIVYQSLSEAVKKYALRKRADHYQERIMTILDEQDFPCSHLNVGAPKDFETPVECVIGTEDTPPPLHNVTFEKTEPVGPFLPL